MSGPKNIDDAEPDNDNANADSQASNGFGERLRSLIAAKDLKPADFARKSGVPRARISEYLNDLRQPSPQYLFMMAKALGVEAEWLRTGEGPVISIRTGGGASGSVNLPEFDISYAMGGGALLADHADATTVAFPRDWLRPIIRGSFDQVFIARGEGDSMQPTLLDGDITIIDTAQRALNSQDRLWAIQYGELGMIKRLRAQPDGGILVLSDNPTVAAFTAYDGEVQLIGRVVWIGRRV